VHMQDFSNLSGETHNLTKVCRATGGRATLKFLLRAINDARNPQCRSVFPNATGYFRVRVRKADEYERT